MNLFKNTKLIGLSIMALLLIFTSCEYESTTNPPELQNNTAKREQAAVEENQSRLMDVQPAPSVDYSIERENLIKRFELANDRTVVFYMYTFLEGYGPVGAYLVNKVSSVNSQLTNPSQIVLTGQFKHAGDYGLGRDSHVMESPAEDGSYGTNGDAVFSFTPDDVYIEHNLKYIVSTVPLKFKEPFLNIVHLTVKQKEDITKLMNRLQSARK